MANPHKSVIGQLSVVQGVRYPHADNILVIEPGTSPTPGRDGVALYALVELSGLVPPPPELRQLLLDNLSAEFSQSTGSITAGLQQAIARVNLALYQYNKETMRDNRQGGGVSCVAVRGSDLYIVQGGPALAYVVHHGHAVRYPEYSPWFDEDDSGEDAPRPLGASREVDVEIAHCIIEPGDYVVLAESVLGQVAATEEVGNATLDGDVHQIAEYLGDLVEGEDISLLVIEAPPEDAAVEEMEELAPIADRARGHRRGGYRSPGRRAPRSGPEEGGLLGLDWLPFDGRSLVQKLGERLKALQPVALHALQVVVHNAGVLLSRTLPGRAAESDARRPPLPTTHTDAGRQARARPKLSLDTAQRRKIFKYSAIAIPLIVILIAVLAYLQRNRTVYSTYSQLIQAAQAKHEQALTQMADVNQARVLLADSLALLDEAAQVAPKATEPPLLREEILKNLDQLNGVQRLYWIPELYRFTAPQTDLARVVVDGINVYILDQGTNQVFNYVLNETNDGFENSAGDAVLIKQGDQIDDVVVGGLVDIGWIPAGGGRQNSNLVILDDRGSLFDYSATWNVKHRPLAATDQWLYPQAISGFYGNLYVLDTQRNQILKYLSTQADGGYSNPPIEWLTSTDKVDLAGAVDMAIDGHIYILYADGRIVKLLNGEPVPFDVTGIDVPLRNPSALFTNADQETQYLYVADRGNSRVVQLNKDGRFQRQFRVETGAFEDLRSLWVDELEQKMYILSGNSVYVTNLPTE